MNRRTFLRGIGAAGVAGAAGAALGACGTPAARPAARAAARKRAATPPPLEVDHLVTAEWVAEENARKDRTRAWIIPRHQRSAAPAIEGYADKVSYASGDELILRVNTRASSFRAFVYRMGFYGGFGARPVAASPALTGVVQPVAGRSPDTNTVECDWSTSWSEPVTEAWPTGAYLIKLVASTGAQQYVPFTVRDDARRSAYLVQSSVTTWQAYNPYGGYSLYGGIPVNGETDFAARARIVSFDRPYGHSPLALDADGSGDFLGNELPFIYLAERHGLDVSYATDVDLHANPERLLAHRALVSLGHDEYWSAAMRDGAEAALSHGVNLAFFGANACYRQIRFASSPRNGENRRVICYKDAAEDPLRSSHPALVTGGSWATDPVPRPESALIGLMYQSYGGSGPLVVADGSSWVYRGTGLRTGDSIPDVIGSEFDAFEPGDPHPGNVEILGHSPTSSASGNRHADMAYYSAGPGKGAVFASGTASWVSSLWEGTPGTERALGFGNKKSSTLRPLTTVTLNVLAAFGPGPASTRHPSTANWSRFYRANAPVMPSKDVSL
jgi:hypothetical protein